MDTTQPTSSHIGHQVRSQSRLFQDLPWDTDVLGTTGDLASLQLPGLDNFTRRLSAHETRLFSFSDCSLDVTDTHRLLGIELGLLTPHQNSDKTTLIAKPSLNPYTPPSDYSLAQGARMVNLLAPYKLLDIICARSSDFQDRRGAPRSRCGVLDPKVQKLPVANTLKNLTSVLKTFHSSYSPIIGGSGVPTREGDSGAITLPNPSSLLVTQLTINRKSRVINTIESNIVLCALAISYLLKDTSESGVPGLPDDSETFANVVGDSQLVDGKIVQSEDTKFLIRICEESRPPNSKQSDKLWHIITPLACALYLSPLSVFCSRPLTSLSFQRRALIMSCSSLGNQKPPLLRACEGIVWDVILDIVSGRLHPSLTVSTLNQRLPWDDILKVDSVESINSWFVEQRALDTAQSVPQQSSSDQPQSQLQNPCLAPHPELSEVPRPVVATASHSEQPSEEEPERHGNPQPVIEADTPVNDAATGCHHPSNKKPDNTDPTRKSSRISELTAEGKGPNNAPADSEVNPKGPRRPARKVTKKVVSAPTIEDDDSDVSMSGTWEYPVDVDAFVASRDPVSLVPILLHKKKEQMLDLDQTAVRIPVKPDEQMLVCDIDGGEHDISMPTHFDDYCSRLRSIYARAKTSYKDGKPPHISDPGSSVFRRMSYEEFSAKGPTELAEILKSKCIVVTDWAKKRTGFDAENLQEIVSLFRPISIQDYSLRSGGDDAPTSIPEIVQGTMQQVLDNSALGDNGRVLNALDLPCPQALSVPPALSSDFIAWQAMTDTYGLQNFMAYPNGDVSWYLAGLRGALTFFHLDSDGFCTGVKVEYGKKLWGIMIPRSPIGPHDTSNLTAESFSLDEIAEDGQDFDIEFVVLRQQDGIIMGPNTFHLAGTLDDAICHGFHFYSPATLLRTAAGVINTFILSDFLSNTHHNASRAILLRMLGFNFDGHFERRFGDNEHYRSHLLDITTWEGVAGLMALCNLAILVNVLDFRTYLGPNQAENDHPTERQSRELYAYDSNHIIWPERMAMCHGRGMALAILKAIADCCIITDTATGSELQNLPLRHLARQMVAIAEFKDNAVASKLDGAPHCTSVSLERQLQNVASWNTVLADLYKSPNDINLDCSITSFTGQEVYQVQWMTNPHAWFQGKSFTFMADGYTVFDRKFFNPSRGGTDEERPRKRAKTSL